MRWEMSENLRTTKPKARKQYKCVGCHKTIEIGEIHVKDEFVDAGQIGTWRLCLECDSLKESVFALYTVYGDETLSDWEFFEGITEVKKGLGR